METSRSGKPVFVLGVGVQKGGTSWLHSYLASHPGFESALPKEMHIFDAMLRPETFGYFRTRAQLAMRTENKIMTSVRNMRHDGTTASHKLRIKMMAEPQAYVDFFLGLAAKGHATGDFTPSYAALSSDDFEFINDLLSPHFDVRAVLLLRDPIARTFSRVRHFRRRYEAAFPVAMRGDDNEVFRRFYDSAHVWMMADYPRIVKALEPVFPLYVSFFERLFDQGEIDAICSFLDLESHPGNLDRKVNASPHSVKLSPENRALAGRAYAHVYDFCRERFEGVEDIWAFPDQAASSGS